MKERVYDCGKDYVMESGCKETPDEKYPGQIVKTCYCSSGDLCNDQLLSGAPAGLVPRVGVMAAALAAAAVAAAATGRWNL